MGETAKARVRKKKAYRHLPENFTVNKEFIKELQKDLSLTSHPYRTAASVLGCTEREVVALLKEYIKAGAIRRIASVLRPETCGISR